jgi:hypothetical protein
VVVAADGSAAYSACWAHSDAEECRAFEAVVDRILESWRTNPEMHVYHYAPYEPSTFKRLMGQGQARRACTAGAGAGRLRMRGGDRCVYSQKRAQRPGIGDRLGGPRTGGPRRLSALYQAHRLPFASLAPSISGRNCKLWEHYISRVLRGSSCS